jgi:hypothetical protein
VKGHTDQVVHADAETAFNVAGIDSEPATNVQGDMAEFLLYRRSVGSRNIKVVGQ